MKQPVRPMPALRDRHRCAQHWRRPLPGPGSVRAGRAPGFVCCRDFFL